MHIDMSDMILIQVSGILMCLNFFVTFFKQRVAFAFNNKCMDEQSGLSP